MPKSNRWHRKSSLAFKANVHFPLSTTEDAAASSGLLRPQRMAALSAKQSLPRRAAKVRNRAFRGDSQISVSGCVWPPCSRVRFATPARSLCVLPRHARERRKPPEGGCYVFHITMYIWLREGDLNTVCDQSPTLRCGDEAKLPLPTQTGPSWTAQRKAVDFQGELTRYFISR
ncbi:MAG: hypothetical protein ACI9KS_002941 [Sulfitobacter sp.]|jgi:hypothetical protein